MSKNKQRPDPLPIHKVSRIVTQLPLQELWNEAGRVAATRDGALTSAEVQERLRAGPVPFVVANIDEPLRWIAPQECYEFWKGEVRRHLCDQSQGHLDDYPGEYLYWASVWTLQSGQEVIVLEVAH